MNAWIENIATVRELLDGLSDAEVHALRVDALRAWRRKHPQDVQFSMHGGLGLEMAPLLLSRKGRPTVDSDTLSGLKEPFITEQNQPSFLGVSEFIGWFFDGDTLALDVRELLVERSQRQR